jgi:hypothetical protein
MSGHKIPIKRKDLNGSSSSNSSISESGTDLASLFECPVCFDYVLPPILQCQMGHLVCSSCRSKLTCCPTCRGSLGNIRNLAMEKVASNVKFPCKHSNNGCAASLVYTEKVDHEEVCEFRPYQVLQNSFSPPSSSLSKKGWKTNISFISQSFLSLSLRSRTVSVPRSKLQVAGLTRLGHAALDNASQKHNDTARRRHCVSRDRHQSAWRSRLGDDAILLRAQLYARAREAGKIRWASAVLRHRPTDWVAKGGRKLCLPTRIEWE